MMNFSTELTSPVFKKVAEAAEELGVEAFLIGGFVRDLILKRESKDLDVVVIDPKNSRKNTGIDLARLLGSKYGAKNLSEHKNFGTAGLSLDGWDVEFVVARKESYSRNSRNPEVEAGTLEEDQERRDFTINAMSIALSKEHFGELFDPFNGLGDLNNRLLKTPTNPSITFSDDPLRMMRAIRFACQLDFEIDPAAYKAIGEHSERISIIAPERCAEELNKILLCNEPSKGFILLLKTGILPLLLPELTDLRGVDEVEGQRHKDNFYHTLEVVDNISQNTDNVWLRWAALLHDIGKAPTKRFDEKIGWTFHAHEFKGSKMVAQMFKRLRLPLNEKMKFVKKIVMLSSRPIALANEGVTDSAVRRLLFDAGEDIEDLMTMCEADITTKNDRKRQKYLKNFKIVRSKLKSVEEKDRLRVWQPPVSGDEIIARYQLKPSKIVGDLKEAVKEAILEGEIPNEREAALAFLDVQAQSKGIEIPHQSA